MHLIEMLREQRFFYWNYF